MNHPYLYNERKGIWLQFQNLLSIRLFMYFKYSNIFIYCSISVTRNFYRDAEEMYRESFLFCFTVVHTMEVFHREIWYNRLVEHGIKLLCRVYSSRTLKIYESGTQTLNRLYRIRSRSPRLRVSSR